jgi:hypothetical protein
VSEGIWTPPGGSADRPSPESERPIEPSEQELADRYREELKRIKVSDLVVQTLYTVSSLAYHKLASESRDLDQARLAIESMRALLPVLEGQVDDQVVRDFKQVVANLQLAYADAAKQAAPAAETTPPAQSDQPPAEPEAASAAGFDQEDLEPVDDEELGGGD